jgi:hypothetical protein
MKTATVVLAAVSCAFALPVEAADGVLVVQKTTRGTATITNQIQIEKTRMRADMMNAGGRKQVIVFDGNAQVLRIIDDEAKTYNEITKADVDQIASQMAGAMSMMQQQMANMPPEQRAQMEAMMRGRGMPAGGAQPKTEYVKTGTDKVGKWTCTKYDAMRGGAKTAEMCTVDPKALGFTADDFTVTKQLGEFFGKLIPQQSDQLFRLGSVDEKGFEGLPVRVVGTGPQASTTEVTDASRQSFPDSLFTVPAGYQKQAFGFGRGRGRQ